MHVDHPAESGNPNCSRVVLVLLLLVLPIGCTPKTRIAGPENWPKQWSERTLWATPNANIYAASGASAGELDRLVERARSQYASDAGQPAPPVLIIARDAGEAYPGDDFRALLRCALRMSIERNPPEPSDDQPLDAPPPTLEEKVDDAMMGLWTTAAVSGVSVEELAGTATLACDAQCLREVCDAPDVLASQPGGALIVPTRSCLRGHVRRIMRGTLSLYGIGPVVQTVFLPVVAVAESEAVDRLDQLRGVALFSYWLFEHADLPIERKRAIASERLEDWSGGVEASAAKVVGAAKQ